jgi:cytochrome c
MNMRYRLMTSVFYAALLAAGGSAFAAGDAARGEKLYSNMCASCHSIDFNGVGPKHKGLFDRKAGSLTDYAYSPALKSSKVVWNEKTLDKWLANPAKMIPGEKMGYKVRSAKDRADLIAYLKQGAAPQ